MNESLPEELKEALGRAQEPAMELVTRRDIRKYAIATGQREARYLEGSEAPPRFHATLLRPLGSLEDIGPEGSLPDPLLGSLPFEVIGSGRTNTQYFQPIRCGDYLVIQRKLTGARPAANASPHRWVCETTWIVESDYGAPVVIETTEHFLR